MRANTAKFRSKSSSPWNDENPIVAEIFGPERFAQHAHTLAAVQKVTASEPSVYSVVDRLEDNSSFLQDIYRQFSAAVGAGKPVTPAAEWLIDNYHLVEQHIRNIKQDLPRGFYRQLPKLADGPLAGHPRIFGLIWAYVAHTDSQFQPETLTHFVRAYQEVQPLTIGELWAAAIALRLTFIENLRRLSVRMSRARLHREAADNMADKLLALDAGGAARTFAGSPDKVAMPFAVQMLQRLRDIDDPRAARGLAWLQERVAASGHSFETIVNDEHHRQAAANVSVRNIVTSLRLVSDVNWQAWFEEVSHVDSILRSNSTYVEMDSRSRNMYRTAIEELSRGSRRGETEIAELVIARSAGREDSPADPGNLLLGGGRKEFEREIAFTPPFTKRLQAAVRAAGLAGYLGSAGLLSLALVAAVLIPLFELGVGWWLLCLFGLLTILPASDVALTVVNQLASAFVPPRLLPGLALREGIPERYRTLVAVPVLLTDMRSVEALLERLETHFLSNGGGEVYFALVSDWADADVQRTSEDTALLHHAMQGIEVLNRRHNTDRLLLLHRQRLWNPAQGQWMGWERKRGKLQELNRLLRGDSGTSFVSVPENMPGGVKFVISLDQDTRMPRDCVRRMVGKLAHSLNRPAIDGKTGRVAVGHGVLQPRVTASLPIGDYGSYYQKLFSTGRGIDPYAWAASDIYQDLFDEGSFAGKGIYDVDAFESAISGRIPANAILSHDLFEGIFARAALLADVEVIEDYPERYEVAAARMHRWVRGDWQLLPWILGKAGASSIPPLGRWKMIDNLRRSLVPIAQISTLAASLALLTPNAASLTTLGIVLTVLLPPLLPALAEGLRPGLQHGIAGRLRLALAPVRQALVIGAANLVFLPSLAALMADAILRTLHRLVVSKRNMLEWTTAAQVQANAQPGLQGYYWKMWVGPAFGLVLLADVGFHGWSAWYWLLPFAAFWLAAPAVASWLSQPALFETELATSGNEFHRLRRTARETWRFFDAFVTTGDNALPPDNFQEDPKPVVAHRTSPTNIGLYVLSVAAAREFGWISTFEAAGRLEATLATLHKLEKFRGHLLNWYDTESLVPLEPRYVSSVDSGNLAGHLIALANFCDTWPEQIPAAGSAVDGIEDALALTIASLAEISGGTHSSIGDIHAQAESLRAAVAKLRPHPDMLSVRLVEISILANTLSKLCAGLGPQAAGAAYWASQTLKAVEGHFKEAAATVESLAALRKRLASLAQQCRDLAYGMDFRFLLDPQRDLLSIGYRVLEGMRDANCYDMLASEARLASFFAVAKGDAPARHWFKLGRATVLTGGGAALVSWSGSMFEYLMPSLVMRAPTGGLLDQTTRLIVERQQDYGAERGVPWGISESAFSGRDTGFTYQYSNFGVPGLGLKRGLAADLVIAPYATGLAAMVSPRRAAQNFASLETSGARGPYGYYEALDYTPARLLPGEKVSPVQAYFAHHQGMTIVGICNAILAGRAREMFHREPGIRAAELLLQERVPHDLPEAATVQQQSRAQASGHLAPVPPRRADLNLGMTPATHVLSNGQLSVMMTAAGSGYTSWNGIAITRWREDPTSDDWGQFFYIRNVAQGNWWTAGHMPSRLAADSQHTLFSEHKIEMSRKDGAWRTGLECVVSPETNAEVRSLTITNDGYASQEVEITTYAELVLAPSAADNAHPAFSKMFIETEFLPELGVLLATRRRRSPDDPEVWVAQLLVVEAQRHSEIEFETDRAKFLGRCNDVSDPAALRGSGPLGKSAGAVLDPIFALRCRVFLPRARQIRLTLWTMVASTREAVLDIVDQHRQVGAFDRAQTLAWTQAQIELRHIGINMEDAHLFQELASHVLYAGPSLRSPLAVLRRDSGSQSSLWPQGISGDRPVVLLRIDAVEDIPVARELIKAFSYWKAKRIAVDLVILNDRMSSYVQDLQQGLDAAAAGMRTVAIPGREGDLFLLRADLLSQETLKVLTTSARVVLFARHGRLAAQLARLRSQSLIQRPQVRKTVAETPASAGQASTAKELLQFNGYGGFSRDGKEYVAYPSVRIPTPAPWSNVIANPNFGFTCSADGPGFSWIGNSRESQITGWSNDPVSNRVSEAIYVRDMKSGEVVGPALLPLRDGRGSYEVRHGFGYSTYKRDVVGLHVELTQSVPLTDTVMLSRLRLVNRSSLRRTLSLTYYVEWALGAQRAQSAHHIVTESDSETGALLARNRWNQQFRDQVAFIDIAGRQTSWTGDRYEFLGKLGSAANPAALMRNRPLSNFTGAGVDPCGALQTEFTVEPGETAAFTLLLGAAPDTAAARELIVKYRKEEPDAVLQSVKDNWAGILGAVTVKTPDPAFDAMMNGWLLYQTLSCRMWGRAGFYQASGAYGFRDQLQDSMAMLYARPDLTRSQILRAAGRQFTEGDVQHWWLPETGTGIRTRISDDAAWLAYCTARYVLTTGDAAILDEPVAFIEGQHLLGHEHEAFFQPVTSAQSASLFEHCARGLDYSLKFGSHGLPLMGTGDWNDGMNRVGAEGKGESVWLAWLLIRAIKDFSLAAADTQDPRIAQWQSAVESMTAAVEKHAWDGKWYRRAFYDDGSPLGSAANAECAIDAIAQSWAVMSGGARRQRARSAMQEVHDRLIHPGDRLALLFAPPFDKGERDPGYIKAYPPGIRENGGQYTHGAIWSVFAFAELGDAERAWELFLLLNPVNHALARKGAEQYRTEPYVVAADVYSVGANRGRGGWTWYTGAGGWLYRAGLEAILGLRKAGNVITMKPSMPPDWDQFTITVRSGTSALEINVRRDADSAISSQAQRPSRDGEFKLVLPDSGGTQRVVLLLPRKTENLTAAQ